MKGTSVYGFDGNNSDSERGTTPDQSLRSTPNRIAEICVRNGEAYKEYDIEIVKLVF